MIEALTLSSGATLLMERVSGTRTVSTGFWIGSGSRDEADPQRGMTHFVEHMLFKGTHTRSAGDIAREIDRVGGYLNAFTERECACFHCTLPSDSQETAIDVLSDMVFNSLLGEADIIKEKEVIISEIASAADDPEEASFDAYLKAAWPNSRLSRKITGEIADIRAMDREGLRAHYLRHFVPANTVICAAGNLEPQRFRDMLEARLPEGALRPWRGRENRPAPGFRGGLSRLGTRTGQIILYIGFPIAGRLDRRAYYALSIMNTAFGDSMSSRLFQNIRERYGFCYTIYSFPSLFEEGGLLTICASTAPANFAELADAVLAEVESTRRDGFTRSEIKDAAAHLRGSSLMGLEDMEHRMKRLARQFLAGDPVLDAEEGLQVLETITYEEAQDIAVKVFSTAEPALFAFGPRFRDSRRKWRKGV